MKLRWLKYFGVFVALTFWGFVAITAGSVDESEYIEPQQYEDETMQTVTANLVTDDMVRTLLFYRQFGFETSMNVPEQPPYEWAMVEGHGGAIMFQTRPSLAAELPEFADMPTGGSFTIYIVVEDIQAIKTVTDGQDYVVKELHETFYGRKEITVRDPNGYIVTFAQ